MIMPGHTVRIGTLEKYVMIMPGHTVRIETLEKYVDNAWTHS